MFPSGHKNTAIYQLLFQTFKIILVSLCVALVANNPLLMPYCSAAKIL
jgi:hypothetical protein